MFSPSHSPHAQYNSVIVIIVGQGRDYTRIGLRCPRIVSALVYQLFFLQIEAFAETLYSTSGIKNTLLSTEEWMAFWADIYLQDKFDTQCLETVATCTNDRGFDIIWMDSFFHYDNSRENYF